MKQNTYKPQISDVLEAIFDAVYLIFDLIACGFAKGRIENET